MWMEWLVLTPLLWVPVLVALVAIEASLVETDNGVGAGLILICTLLVLQFTTSIAPFTAIAEHPFYALIALVAYLGIGVLWGAFKWRLWVNDKMAKLGEETSRLVEKYQAALADPSKQECTRKTIRDEAEYKVLNSGERMPLQVSQAKGRITTWMAFWPASVVHFFLWDSIRRFYDWTYRLVARSFQRFSDSAYAAHREKFRID